MFTPDEAHGDAMARTLKDALAAPAVGQPRQPDAIRVANPAIGASIGKRVAGDIPVTIAPTPELDDLFGDLLESMSEIEGDVEPSYLENGRIPGPVVRALFEAARDLFPLRPWRLEPELPALRLDIPSLGIDDGCLLVVGHAAEVPGLLIFSSVADIATLFRAYQANPEGGLVGAEILSLAFEPAAELPPAMRREAMEHGWKVDDPHGYPMVQHRDADGVPRPTSVLDVEIATACADALAAFLRQHAERLEALDVAPISELHVTAEDRVVRLTVICGPPDGLESDDFGEDDVPEDDFDDLDWQLDDGPFVPRAGRNDPCPCGSGRKYKKCCLRIDEDRHADHRKYALLHRMDSRLLLRLAEYAGQEFPAAWRELRRDIDRIGAPMIFTAPLWVYAFEIEGRTVADAFLADRSQQCSSEERRWLQSQGKAWLSVWEVEDAEPGRSMDLRDLLSGERRRVRETAASRDLAMRDAILARIVDHDRMSLLGAGHPRLLQPFDAADVVDDVLRGLRSDRPVSVDQLRQPVFCRDLIVKWEEAVEEQDSLYSQPPELRNRDGDPVLPTVDRFDVEAAETAEIRRLIGQLEGAKREPSKAGVATYAFLQSDDTLQEGEMTVIGWVRIDRKTLRIETNSEKRADALRQRIEAACQDRIRHREREHGDLSDLDIGPGTPMEAPSPEEEHYAAAHKARHYNEWPDLPLPALDGMTPRECARTADGRRDLDLLLNHMENQEHRTAPGKPFDFSVIRDELGLSSH